MVQVFKDLIEMLNKIVANGQTAHGLETKIPNIFPLAAHEDDQYLGNILQKLMANLLSRSNIPRYSGGDQTCSAL